MAWEFLQRWKKLFRLTAVAHGDRDAATARVRDAFNEAGAWITDVHFFSDVQTVLTFEVAAARVRSLESELVRAGLVFDDASLAAISEAASAVDDVAGTLAVTFAHGDPDLKHVVPAVPG